MLPPPSIAVPCSVAVYSRFFAAPVWCAGRCSLSREGIALELSDLRFALRMWARHVTLIVVASLGQAIRVSIGWGGQPGTMEEPQPRQIVGIVADVTYPS